MIEIDFCTLGVVCPYLKGHLSKSRYKYLEDCTFDYNSKLVKHGYRRFGNYFSKPICDNCNECRSIRINVNEFKFTKSFKRVFKKNSNTKIVVTKPTLADEKLELYKKYHLYMSCKRSWEFHDLDFMSYYGVYIEGSHNFGYEIDYYVKNKLVCVDLIDIVDDGINSLYCYWDPDFRHLSLGKFSLLIEIRLALRHELSWIYLGFYVKECESLAYKNEYKPYQVLKEYCSIEETPIWEDCPIIS